MTRSALLRARDRIVAEVVADEVARFLLAELNGKEPRRRCATCGRSFAPVHRWHFFHAAECRRTWYRGQFRPRD